MENRTSRLWTFNFISACIANFLMGFSFYLLLTSLPFYLSQSFNADKATIGIVMSFYVIAALLIRPASGYLVDNFPRKLVYFTSFVFFVALTAGYLVASSIILIIVLRFWHGITWGIITTAGNTLAIDIMPSDKRGEGIGYYGLALNLSMAIGPMVGLYLNTKYDFNVLFYTALATGFIGLVFASFIKAPRKEIKKQDTLLLDRFILIKAIPLGVNVLLFSISYGMILSFAAMYGSERGITHTGMFFTLLAVGMAASRIFSGKMIDRGYIRLATIIGITVLFLGLGIFTFCIYPFLYFAGAFLIGIGNGILFPAFQILFVNLGTHSQRGTANSTYYTAFDLGVGIGMFGAGKIAEKFNFSTAFGVSTVASFFALIFFLKITSPYYEKHKLE